MGGQYSLHGRWLGGQEECGGFDAVSDARRHR